MSRPTIAIEPRLTSHSRLLEEAGYHVVALNENALGIAQAIVVNGSENGFLGIQDPKTLAPVIDADGMTPEQVLTAVKNRTIERH